MNKFFIHPQNASILGKHFCLKYQILLLVDTNQIAYTAGLSDPPLFLDEVLSPFFDPLPQHLILDRKTFHYHCKYLEFQDLQKDLQGNIQDLFLLILRQAILLDSSDIHLENFINGGLLRFRVHGDLEIAGFFDKKIFTALCSKIKLESKLNITEIKQAQDGRYHTLIDEIEYDFRISCIPLYEGESIVIRVLYKNRNNLKLKDLNLTSHHLNQLKTALQIPYGILLIVGPTGSGKSTTLYAILEYLQKEYKKIITLEDPPEHQIRLATQVKISQEFDFPLALRAVLRHDPDIIVVGEIRDEITLELAFRAALTGHLVLATLHSNNCISALQRLQNMGIMQQDILASVLLILAQRLCKKPCPYCKDFAQKGCQKCNMQGILGREIATEILLFDKDIKKAIAKNILEEYLESIAFEHIEQNIAHKIKEGTIAPSHAKI